MEAPGHVPSLPSPKSGTDICTPIRDILNTVCGICVMDSSLNEVRFGG